MAICPNCQRTADDLRASCPSGDGYYCIGEDEFYAYSEDEVLGREISGRYVVESVLGRGAMSRVYRAHQSSVDRPVALKVFRPETILGQKPGHNTTTEDRKRAEKRFVREAKVLGQLSHPNCVTVYDFGTEDDGELLYMAMEYVAGSSLRTAIRRGLTVDAVAEIVRQILEGMREAHSMEIVHRDLKPENVLFSYRYSSDERVVKVLDFGIAKLLRADREEGGAGKIYGTPAYMGPEQCRGEIESIGPPADIYALGCLFYEMLCGRLPYSTENPREMVRLHIEAEIPPVQPRKGLEVPESVEEFIERCLQKDPSDRYASAHEALAALRRAFSGSGVRFGTELTVREDGEVRRSHRESGPRKVSVPENRVRGERLDPIGEAGSSNGANRSSGGRAREDAPVSPTEVDPEAPRAGMDSAGEPSAAGEGIDGLQRREARHRGGSESETRMTAVDRFRGASESTRWPREAWERLRELARGNALVVGAVLFVAAGSIFVFLYIYSIIVPG